jgi:hypothetical protein
MGVRRGKAALSMSAEAFGLTQDAVLALLSRPQGATVAGTIKAHRRDRLRGWGGRIRTSMCRENIHLFEMSHQFGFRCPAETAAVPRENDLLRWTGPFPHRGRRLAHIANRAPSDRPASHQSSNPLTQAGRIRGTVRHITLPSLSVPEQVASRRGRRSVCQGHRTEHT